MQCDIRGLCLTTTSSRAAELFDGALDHFFEYRRDAMQAVKELQAADPDFAMGHCLRGYLFMLFGTTLVHDKVAESLTRAESLAAGASAREQGHVAALRAWFQGDTDAADRLWSEILAAHPRDLLALRLQHGNIFWTGRSQALRDTVARVFPAWDPEVPGYGYVQGMFAFGLEECGDHPRAERLGRAAVERNPDDLWAIHAVAHVLEMQGRLAEGVAWLDYPADHWADRNPFRGHLWWHRALFSFESGDYDQVLAIYDRSIRTEKSDFYLDIQNQASLLTRLELQGLDVGTRWHELADYLETRTDDHVLAFTDVHCAMALAADGRLDALEALLASLSRFAETPGNTAAGIVHPVTLPLCQAISAFRSGAPERCVDLLLPLLTELWRSGGSHAQRDIFHQILVEAAIRAGRLDLARALTAERVALRPRSRGSWQHYIAVLEARGDLPGAERAKAEMTRHLKEAAGA